MFARAIRGRVAIVQWAYYAAARIEGYAVTQDARGWSVVGTVVPGTADAYKLAQRPLYFVAPFKGGAWRWPIDAWTRPHDGQQFAARLGAIINEGSQPYGITPGPTP